MPIYEYEDAEGITIEVYEKATQVRDEIVENGRTYKRRPSSFSAPRINQTEHQKGRVLQGYRALEDAGKLRKSEFTPDQVKAAWAMPDNEG